MRLGFFLRGEDPGALHGDVDAEVLPRQLRRVLDRRHLDGAVAAVDGIALNLHLAGKTAMHRVEAKEMGVGLDGSEIVDGDDYDVPAVGLDDRAQRETADTAEAVDRDTDRHCWLLDAQRRECAVMP